MKKINKIGCGKKRYSTEDNVIFVGREQMFLYKSEQLYYYFCEECNSWHLTSNNYISSKKIT